MKKHICAMLSFPLVGFVLSAGAADWPVLKTYRGEYLRRVKLPLGGIGTGTISLSGRGALVDWEIRNQPGKGSTPSNDRWYPSFCVRAETADGKKIARLLEGPLDSETYESAAGPSVPNAAYPRFAAAEFSTAYPLAQLKLTDPKFPAECSLKAFNPLVKGDAKTSGIPAAHFAWKVRNPGKEPIKLSIAATLVHFWDGVRTTETISAGGYRGVKLLSDGGGAPSTKHGEICVIVPEDAGGITTATEFTEPGWGVSIDRAWMHFRDEGSVTDLKGESQKRQVAQTCVAVELKGGEEKEIPFVIGWYYPERKSWTVDGANPWGQPTFGKMSPQDCLTNFYATVYSDSLAAAMDLALRKDALEAKTIEFVKEVLDVKAPAVVKEAALFNLSTLRTETCFRTADGNFFGWEGCFDWHGSCYGNCTHVWGYEHALVDIWPELARRMLDLQFGPSMDEQGGITFRVGLPLATRAQFRGLFAAADGQMQCIVKAHEYVKKTGDLAWLKSHWPAVRKATEFCWIKGGWDADKDGVMEGCQHNTMDVEYYGPNPQMEFLYLAALEAEARMAKLCGDDAFAAECLALKKNGSEWTEKHLFNGSYYEHIIMPPKGEIAKRVRSTSGEGAKNLEDPDYQLGKGCLIDQLLGDYAAVATGLGPVADPEHAKTTIKTILDKCRRFPGDDRFNPMRTFAFQDETSIMMAWYPEGGRPRSPFPYYGETMTGFEYVVAALCAQRGDFAEAERIVKDIRARYDGRKRSPFDEAECGHHYARAMAAWTVYRAFADRR